MKPCAVCGQPYQPRPGLKYSERYCSIACAHEAALRRIVSEVGYGILRRDKPPRTD